MFGIYIEGESSISSLNRTDILYRVGFLGVEPLNRAGKGWGPRGGKTLASE